MSNLPDVLLKRCDAPGETRSFAQGRFDPGHDSWVLGDEPHVSLHFHGADAYARK